MRNPALPTLLQSRVVGSNPRGGSTPGPRRRLWSGEFGRASYLARGEEGTVGVHDTELGRFTVFEPSGAYASEVRAPASYLVPLRSFGTVVLVERQVGADDADGIPDRALDWYDIGDLPFDR